MKVWYTFTEESHSAVKKNGVTQFTDQRTELENIALSEVTWTDRQRPQVIFVVSSSQTSDVSTESAVTTETMKEKRDCGVGTRL